MMFSQSAVNNDLNDDEREGEQETVREGRWKVTERDGKRESKTRLQAVG